MRNNNDNADADNADADIERLARETGVLRFQATCANPGAAPQSRLIRSCARHAR